MPFNEDSSKEVAVNVLTLAALAAGVYGVCKLASDKRVKSLTKKLSNKVSMNMFGKRRRKSRKGSKKARKMRRSHH